MGTGLQPAATEKTLPEKVLSDDEMDVEWEVIRNGSGVRIFGNDYMKGDSIAYKEDKTGKWTIEKFYFDDAVPYLDITHPDKGSKQTVFKRISPLEKTASTAGPASAFG